MMSLLKNIFIAVGLLIVAAVGYFAYTQNAIFMNGVDDTTLREVAQTNTDDALRRLNDLKQITLSQDIFVDPRFTTLIDNSSPVTPLEIGKENPFESTN